LSSADKGGEVLHADVDVHAFGAKNIGFSKFIVCPHGQGGEGVNCLIAICADFLQFFCNLFPHNLWTASYPNNPGLVSLTKK